VTPFLILTAAIAVASVIAAAAFRRPDGVFKRSALAVGTAVLSPYVVAFLAAPFLGDGAGMGVAFILYVVAGATLLCALAASAGAAARHAWTALRAG